MTGVRELAYVVYEVSDLADWEHFGVTLMGMQLGEKLDNGLTLRTDDKVHRWVITEGPADDLVRTAYEVESHEALDALVETLRTAGVDVSDRNDALAVARKVERVVIIRDPIGNEIELVVGFADAHTPFASENLLSSFVTGAGGAGHQVLLSKGVSRDEYMNFYCGLLGFKLSDNIVEELAPGVVADLIFLHCNPRHHTVALGDMPHPKSTHHFMVEVSDIRDVGMAWDRCLAAGQPIEMTLGMHPNDHMFSFYVHTPSGFSVEYGWGGLLIDDATWEPKVLDKLHWWGHAPGAVVAQQLAAAPAPFGPGAPEGAR